MFAARPEPPVLRVGLVTGRADFYGGGQRSLLELAAHLKAARDGRFCEPIVFLPGPGPLAEALAAAGVEWLRLPLAPLRGRAAVTALARGVGLLRAVRRRRIDILHSDTPRGALYAGAAARLLRRRHVWHVRASVSSSALSDRLLLALSDRAIAVSRASAGRSNALRASGKVRVVHTGLAPFEPLTCEAARASLGLPSGRLLLGVIGRVEADKGCEEAIVALALIRRALPDALLAFLGPHDAAGAAALHRVAEGAGVRDAIALLGGRDSAAALLPAFDLIVHPSRHEALPRVLIEALFAGVPVVAASVGGVPEIIESGRCGLLVPPRDPVALATAAAGLAADPDLRRRLTEAGTARARELFGIDLMVRRVLEVYDEIRPHGPVGAAAEPLPRRARGAP